MKFLSNVGANVKVGLIATGGGAVARVAINNADKIPVIGTMPRVVHKAAVFLIGAALAGNKSMHYAGVGAMAVAGTDAVADYVPMIKSINGIDGSDYEEIADELAEQLEEGVYDDVANSEAAMNDDVSNTESAMNAV